MESQSKNHPFLASTFAFAGMGCFVLALADIGGLWSSAGAFRLHHEATTPLALLLAKVVLGLFCGNISMQIVRKNGVVENIIKESFALLLLAMLLLVSSRLLENEAFFTLYDNKGLPVHPTEIVLHPYGGWMSPWQHVVLCLCGIVTGVGMLIATHMKRQEKK